MIVSKRERWMEWAAQAAEEQDPEKLMALAQEINSILETKQQRVNGKPLPDSRSTKGGAYSCRLRNCGTAQES